MWQLIFFLLCTSNTPVNAVILKCETADGTLYFNDRACKAADIETILPCEPKQLSAKEITKIEQQLRQSRNTLHKKAIQQLKQKHALQKSQAKAQKERLRNKAKCETLMRQIHDINQQYKEGYTIKQGKQLARKLAKYENERQRYCNHE
jgi:cellulose biosynthesis protein BcsQ